MPLTPTSELRPYWNADPRPPDEVPVSVIERDKGTEIRISLVRFVGRSIAYVCVQE